MKHTSFVLPDFQQYKFVKKTKKWCVDEWYDQSKKAIIIPYKQNGYEKGFWKS